MEVKISQSVKSKLESKHDDVRILLGFTTQCYCVVIECLEPTALQSNEDIKLIESFFPAGINIVGISVPFLKHFTKYEKYCELCSSSDIVLIEAKECEIHCQFSNNKDGVKTDQHTPEFVSNAWVLNELFTNFYLFNLSEPYICKVIDNGNLKKSLKIALKVLQEKLENREVNFIYSKESPTLITNENDDALEEILKHSQFNSKKFLQRKGMFSPDIAATYLEESISVNSFVKSTSSGTIPTISITKKSQKYINVPIHLNTFVFCPVNSSVSSACEAIAKSISRQLQGMSLTLCNDLIDMPKLSTPVIHNFILPSDIVMNVAYLSEESDESYKDFRKEFMHKLFMEPTTKPMFTKLNSVDFTSKPTPYLVNTHVGLKNPDLGGGVHLVHGCYSYHHYMQDRIDDNGWGCAYRSLQTIVSWFRHQGYTEKPVPSHKQIQEILVEIGDKPKKFIGSRLWIGSIEVSNVLSHYLGVTSKIMSLSRGSDMETKGRELARHFDTVGTPIMIGGGVLAHTILGVSFSELSGETNFLILDPHYTGGEDLKVIQSKGWCGWKDNDFWDKNAFYNLCIPLVPDSY